MFLPLFFQQVQHYCLGAPPGERVRTDTADGVMDAEEERAAMLRIASREPVASLDPETKNLVNDINIFLSGESEKKGYGSKRIGYGLRFHSVGSPR